MITEAPNFSARRGPMMRPRISLPLPGANGTTMETGRPGQSWAAAGRGADMSADMSARMAANILMAGIGSSLRENGFRLRGFQSAVMLAALMIGHHFSISAFW